MYSRETAYWRNRDIHSERSVLESELYSKELAYRTNRDILSQRSILESQSSTCVRQRYLEDAAAFDYTCIWVSVLRSSSHSIGIYCRGTSAATGVPYAFVFEYDTLSADARLRTSRCQPLHLSLAQKGTTRHLYGISGSYLAAIADRFDHNLNDMDQFFILYRALNSPIAALPRTAAKFESTVDSAAKLVVRLRKKRLAGRRTFAKAHKMASIRARVNTAINSAWIFVVIYRRVCTNFDQRQHPHHSFGPCLHLVLSP